jgi:hypothetical protein
VHAAFSSCKALQTKADTRHFKLHQVCTPPCFANDPDGLREQFATHTDDALGIRLFLFRFGRVALCEALHELLSVSSKDGQDNQTLTW